MDEYRAANRANWDDRVPIHLGADEYRVEALIRDPKLLSAVVTHDRAVFGDVRGRTLLHAQCHIGTDTLSWARLGAQVTGFDFSADAIAAARSLATRMALPARFIEAELYAAADIIPESFDLVYTGVGAICWLPDIAGWARMMAHFCDAEKILWCRGFQTCGYPLDIMFLSLMGHLSRRFIPFVVTSIEQTKRA